MANRTGIELLPGVCRIVEAKTRTRAHGGGASNAGPRVRVFHEIPYSAADPGSLTAELRKVMKGLERRAAVAVWGLRSTHQALLLPPAAPADLAAMARREARTASGNAPAGPLADGIVVGELRDDGRREVGYVSVPSEEIRARLQPLVDAGFIVEAAVTPALAHAMLVRQRRTSTPDAVTTVLSVNAHATAMTVVRGGVVLFARELTWGYETERLDDSGAVPPGAAFAARVASELRRSLVYLRQSHRVDIGRVLVCGDVPDMRTLTGPLMNELTSDVETLDVADDVDLSRLTEPSEGFRSRFGAWRTALALATGAAPLTRLEVRDARRFPIGSPLARRVGIAAAAGLLITAAGWGALGYLSASATADQQRLRRAVGALEPELERQDDARRSAVMADARQAAMRAFASQGPRLARVLETVSRATPADISLTAFTVEPGVGSWRVTAEGQAEGANAAAAQATFNQFLKTLGNSPLLGHPVTPPSLRIHTADPGGELSQAPIEPQPAPAERPPQEIETRRPAVAGPAYIEVARDGRLYRIPLRRLAGDVDIERQNDLRRRQQAQAASASLSRVAAPVAAGAAEPPARHPASVLDFTLQYEVRK